MVRFVAIRPSSTRHYNNICVTRYTRKSWLLKSRLIPKHPGVMLYRTSPWVAIFIILLRVVIIIRIPTDYTFVLYRWIILCDSILYIYIYIHRTELSEKKINNTENLGRLGFWHRRRVAPVFPYGRRICWPRVLSHETDTFDFNTHYH